MNDHCELCRGRRLRKCQGRLLYIAFEIMIAVLVLAALAQWVRVFWILPGLIDESCK